MAPVDFLVKNPLVTLWLRPFFSILVILRFLTNLIGTVIHLSRLSIYDRFLLLFQRFSILLSWHIKNLFCVFRLRTYFWCSLCVFILLTVSFFAIFSFDYSFWLVKVVSEFYFSLFLLFSHLARFLG